MFFNEKFLLNSEKIHRKITVFLLEYWGKFSCWIILIIFSKKNNFERKNNCIFRNLWKEEVVFWFGKFPENIGIFHLLFCLIYFQWLFWKTLTLFYFCIKKEKRKKNIKNFSKYILKCNPLEGFQFFFNFYTI